MNRTVPLAVACVVFLGSLAWFWSSGNQEPVAGAASRATPIPGVATTAAVDPVRPPAEEAQRLTVDASNKASKDEPGMSTEGPADQAFLQIRIEGIDRTPLFGARVTVHQADHAGHVVEGFQDELNQPVSTSREGIAEFRLPPGLELRGIAGGRNIGYEGTSFVIPPLDAGEERELVIPLDPEVVTRYHARLVDRETSAPVAGASIHSGRGGHYFPRRIGAWAQAWPWVPGEGEPEAITGANGEFSLEASSIRDSIYEIHAEGYGPFWVRPNSSYPDPVEPDLLHVSPTGTISGTIVLGGADSGLLEVGVVASSFALRDKDNDSMVFGDVLWKSELLPGGKYRLENVPSRVELQLEVRAGSDVVHRASRPLVVEPGEELSYSWIVGGGSAVRGRLVREDGDPPGETPVWLSATQDSTASLATFSSYEAPVMEGRSGEDGSFLFEDVPAGAYFVGPAPGSHRGAPPTYAVRVEAPTLEEALVTIPSELTIEGVVTLDGEPVAGADVYVARSDLKGWVRGESGREGRFRLGPLLPGTWNLRGGLHMGNGEALVGGDPIQLPAGTQDAQLPLLRGARLSGECVEGRTGREISAFLCVRTNGKGSLRTAGGRQEFNFPALRAGTQSIHAWTSEGLVGRLDVGHLEPGEHREGLRVELFPGGTVRVKATGPSAPRSVGFVRNGEEVGGVLLNSALPSFTVLEPGVFGLTRQDTHGGPSVEFGEVTVVLGQEVVVEIEE